MTSPQGDSIEIASPDPPDSSDPKSEQEIPRYPGMYLHVPFCSEICPYCDFAVRKGRSGDADLFVQALQQEIRGLGSGELLPEAPDLADYVSQLVEAPFDTVYLGGGTPSFLNPDQLGTVFGTLFRGFHLRSGTTFYLEANPEDVDAERLQEWRHLGIDTLSLGIQSLRDDRLQKLGRRHRAEDARRAVAQAKEAGFKTVSVDLIYGVPGQTLESWTEELQEALDMGVDHLSLYELEIHARTAFGKRQAQGEEVELPLEEQTALFLRTHEVMDHAGWDVYEVSNFARSPEHRSRHNRKYWHHVPYLGIGPSAHSLVADWRFWNERNEPKWRRLLEDGTSPAAGWEKLPASAMDLERLMLGLRIPQGVDLDTLQSLSGPSFLKLNRPKLEEWRDERLLTWTEQRILPSRRGMAVADHLAAELDLRED